MTSGDTLSRIMRTATTVRAALVLVSLTAAAACGSTAPAPEPAPEPAPAAAPAGPRVFFVKPQDGATVMSPVSLEFGAQDFQIDATGMAGKFEYSARDRFGACRPRTGYREPRGRRRQEFETHAVDGKSDTSKLTPKRPVQVEKP